MHLEFVVVSPFPFVTAPRGIGKIAFDEAAKTLNTNGVSGKIFADDGNGLIGGYRVHGTNNK